MIKKLLAAAAVAAGAFVAAPASALPVSTDLGAQVGSGTTEVALYCNNRGVCVRAPRSGYFYRSAPPVYIAPAYRRPVYNGGYRNGGYRNNTVRRTTVTRTTRPNGNTVVRRKTVVR